MTNITNNTTYEIGSIQRYDLGTSKVTVTGIDMNDRMSCPDDQGGFTILPGVVSFRYFDNDTKSWDDGECSLLYAQTNWCHTS